jgi:hypothetical protein
MQITVELNESDLLARMRNFEDHLVERKTSRRDKNCVRAGGCYYCLVIRPSCWETGRMNRECWERGIFGPPMTEAERTRRAKAKWASLP